MDSFHRDAEYTRGCKRAQVIAGACLTLSETNPYLP